MAQQLGIIDLYNSSDTSRNNAFRNKVDSKLRIVTNKNNITCSYEWLDMIEETIIYIDNILHNPNRFIVNEEDIVKVELARRVTVESIKHLARNTNLIQDFNKKTGDVRPSKILNINKEESFDTYENRFIYSLIQNINFFINRKKRDLILENTVKNSKKFEYEANTNVGKEKINVSFVMNAKEDSTEKIVSDDGNDVLKRIESVENKIKDLMISNVYKDLARKHIALVTSPIKKTNVILKNVNFQYALKLWNYLQTHTDNDAVKNDKNSHDYYDDGRFKSYLDDSFLLNYLVINAIDRKDDPTLNKSDLTEKLIGNIVEKIMDINQNISEEQLKDIVSKQYTVYKYRNITSDKKICDLYKKSIKKYLEKVKKINFNGEEISDIDKEDLNDLEENDESNDLNEKNIESKEEMRDENNEKKVTDIKK